MYTDNVAICPVRAPTMAAQSNYKVNPCMLFTRVAHRNGDSTSATRLNTCGNGRGSGTGGGYGGSSPPYRKV